MVNNHQELPLTLERYIKRKLKVQNELGPLFYILSADRIKANGCANALSMLFLNKYIEYDEIEKEKIDNLILKANSLDEIKYTDQKYPNKLKSIINDTKELYESL